MAAAAGEDLALALDNLIENALTYSPQGGRVKIAWARAGGSGLLTVADDGPGLAPGEETRVLGRFYRGEAGRGRPGTGLGLPIVRTIAGAGVVGAPAQRTRGRPARRDPPAPPRWRRAFAEPSRRLRQGLTIAPLR